MSKTIRVDRKVYEVLKQLPGRTMSDKLRKLLQETKKFDLPPFHPWEPRFGP